MAGRLSPTDDAVRSEIVRRACRREASEEAPRDAMMPNSSNELTACQKNRSSDVEYSSLPSRASRTFFHQESSGEYSFLRSKESSRTVLRGSLFFYITCSIGGIILVDTSLRRDQLECADRTKSLSLSRGDLRQAAC